MKPAVLVPDPEVKDKPVRRTFTAEYKLRILAEADAAKERGELGALLRREGLTDSHLSKWRIQRDRGALSGLEGARPGRKSDTARHELSRLRRENARLRGHAPPG